MKLKTNKLLTLTLASSLVAITAGCGGTKAAAPKAAPVVVPDPVTYTEWAAGTTIATDDTANAFLAGVAAIAGTGGAADTPVTLTGVTANAVVETLNLAYEVTPEVTTLGSEATAVTFGGAATNGVAFSATTGALPADARYFAGVIAGADVGVPLTSTTADGTWNGIFQAVGANAVERAFVLNVNFDDSQVSAIVPLTGDDASADGIMSYFFVGNFDAGVITGDIIFGDFGTGNALPADALTAAGEALRDGVATGAVSPASDGVGTLTGLIGANGALGAFYSTADGALGYAGGFVALTAENVGGDNPNVLYASWSDSDDVTIAADLTSNGFLASLTTDADGLTPNTDPASTFTTLNLAEVITEKVETDQGGPGDATARAGVAGTDGVALGGEAADGVAFFTTGATTESRYFAGLHFGTDLGAPITTDTGTATWNGLIQTVSGTPASMFDAKAFELTVNFADSEVSAHVTTDTAGTNFGIASYYLTGEYDDAGVITGTVSYAIIADSTTGRDGSTANGVLSGLIGATEAVGAFYSNAEDATGYAGGFVATSAANVTDAADALVAYDPVEYADWTTSATQATVITANAFLAGDGDSLPLAPTANTTEASVTDESASGAITGGTSFFMTGAAGSEFYFAGLHNDTNLGLPVPTTGNVAMWSGMFETVSGTAGQQVTEKAITLAVTFGASPTITGSVAVGSTVDASPAYHINGTYDTSGVISGFVAYNASAADSAAGVALAVTGGGAGTGTLTGLIGASGAIGAFHSSGTSDGTGATGYAGGFYVKP